MKTVNVNMNCMQVIYIYMDSNSSPIIRRVFIYIETQFYDQSSFVGTYSTSGHGAGLSVRYARLENPLDLLPSSPIYTRVDSREVTLSHTIA